MGTKLYVGNLNYNTSELSLKELFSADGREVASVSIIMDRETGRSRGFAFVEMTTDEFAQQALKNLDGADLDGRQIRINEARERERGAAPRSYGGGGGGGFGGPPRSYAPPGGGGAAPSRFGPNSPPGGADARRGAGNKGRAGGGPPEGDRGKRGGAGAGRRGRGGEDDGW